MIKKLLLIKSIIQKPLQQHVHNKTDLLQSHIGKLLWMSQTRFRNCIWCLPVSD